ncbi:unnamed protein product [Cuscuta campestris]|uniref:IST1-like protein n=1 Tax=Cuscuta campestris TaxID=132261 RepID=A0A484LNW6_9ASTE|nr:unnamed protein product [Cuscuta campestris]
MGKKIDALLGRNSKWSAKLKATTSLAISRVAVLKNQRHARSSIARSDLLQLLTLGQHQRALLRVKQVMKEENMLDVLAMVQGFCYLLMERVALLEHQKDCPEETKEAISSLIFAATRCGDFPELVELRSLFSAKYGKEFVSLAVDLRNNCGVNPKVIQKLSTRTPSYEERLMILKEIAAEHNIPLHIEEPNNDEDATEGQNVVGNGSVRANNCCIAGLDTEVRRKYKDVGDAAQAAFESAADAAEAARAAVELSRSDEDTKEKHIISMRD